MEDFVHKAEHSGTGQLLKEMSMPCRHSKGGCPHDAHHIVCPARPHYEPLLVAKYMDELNVYNSEMAG